MNELLAKLRDIHLPEAPGWWPPAPGWWVSAAVLAAAAAGIVWWRRRQLARTRTPQYIALEEIRALRNRYRREKDAKQLFIRLSELMRRVALSINPRREVASLTGEQWLEWLDRNTTDHAFTRGAAKILADAPYRPTPQGDAEEVLQACEAWLVRLDLQTAGKMRPNTKDRSGVSL